MTSSSLPDSSTCAEWTLNVTGPQRNALIRLWEQRATGSHLKGEAFRTAVFTRPYIHLVTYVMPLTHNIILTSLCSSVSMHTHHSTLLPAGPDHPAQLVYPNVDSSVGRTTAGIYHITVGSAEIVSVWVHQALSLPKVPTQISPINNLFLILIS